MGNVSNITFARRLKSYFKLSLSHKYEIFLNLTDSRQLTVTND